MINLKKKNLRKLEFVMLIIRMNLHINYMILRIYVIITTYYDYFVYLILLKLVS